MPQQQEDQHETHPCPQMLCRVLKQPQPAQGCHHEEMRQFRAPRIGAYLPGFGMEQLLCFPLCLGRDLCHPPACWVSVTCPRWVTGTRAAAPVTPPAPGDSSPRSCSGRCQGTAGACALWIGPAPCPSGAPRTGGLRDAHVSPTIPSAAAGNTLLQGFWGFWGSPESALRRRADSWSEEW